MKKAIDNIIYILGAILLIVIVYLNDKYALMLTITAVFLVIIGLLLLMNGNNYAALILPIGICLSMSIAFYKAQKFALSTAAIFFFLSCLALIMLITIIKYHYSIKSREKTHKITIDAEITDLVRNPNFDIDYYTPVLTYEIDGESFDVNYNKGFTKQVPQIGDTIRIYVNPNDHSDVFFKPELSTLLKNYISSILIILICIFILISIFI